MVNRFDQIWLFRCHDGVTFQIGDKATNTLDVDLNQSWWRFKLYYRLQRGVCGAESCCGTDFQAEADNFATGAIAHSIR